LALDHGDPMAGAGEEVSDRRADYAGAEDGDVQGSLR
jgi:hypothetical protein